MIPSRPIFERSPHSTPARFLIVTPTLRYRDSGRRAAGSAPGTLPVPVQWFNPLCRMISARKHPRLICARS